MQTSQMISVIREKAIEANPAIMDFKFGCILLDMQGDKCVLLHPGEDEIIVYAWTGDIHSFPLPFGEMTDEEKKRYRIKRFKKDETGVFSDISDCIGRPIRLADVLLAIENMQISLSFYGDGKVWIIGKPNRRGRANAVWNLRSDDLSLQSPETIEFIYNLVK